MEHIYYQKDFVTIIFDERNHLIEVIWGEVYPTEEIVKGGSNKFLEAAEHYGSGKVLIDYRNVKGTWTNLNEWIKEDWSPRAYKAGIRYIALTNAQDVFSKFALEEMIKDSNPDFIRIFDNELAGKIWLVNQNTSTEGFEG